MSIYSFGLKDSDVGIVPWILFFVFVASFLAVTVIFIMVIPAALHTYKAIENGNFLVTTDVVVYKEEKTVSGGTGKRRYITYEKTIHFQRFGDIYVDSTCYEMASPDDVFYMVILSETAKNPLKYYPEKLYAYKE